MSATPPCWYSYNVWLDNSFNECSGGQIFVKRTNYTSAPFLAVQLCNSTRQSLVYGVYFVHDNIQNNYVNIQHKQFHVRHISVSMQQYNVRVYFHLKVIINQELHLIKLINAKTFFAHTRGVRYVMRILFSLFYFYHPA